MSVSESIDQFISAEFGSSDTSVFRDLTLNFKKIMEDSPLEVSERWMNLLALGQALHWSSISNLSSLELKNLGLEENQIQECRESAAIMGMLNVYYKFKGFLTPEVLADSAFQRAGLRMNSLSKPLNGKERFEMMAFSVSVLNGCPTCVVSHEKALTDIGVSRDKIHELARLAAVVKGLSHLKE